MAIARYTTRNPWRDLDQLTNRLGQMFDSEWPTPSSGGDWVPAVDVEETPDELTLTAELPGLDREDVEIELENNILTVRGQRAETKTSEERRFHVWERRYGSFQRSFTLPRTVSADSISAEFENGLLRVHMPKAAEAKGRRIEIGGEVK
jgi:HSP20 family protein